VILADSWRIKEIAPDIVSSDYDQQGMRLAVLLIKRRFFFIKFGSFDKHQELPHLLYRGSMFNGVPMGNNGWGQT